MVNYSGVALNSLCPCGSQYKYKRCCFVNRNKELPKKLISALTVDMLLEEDICDIGIKYLGINQEAYQLQKREMDARWLNQVFHLYRADDNSLMVMFHEGYERKSNPLFSIRIQSQNNTIQILNQNKFLSLYFIEKLRSLILSDISDLRSFLKDRQFGKKLIILKSLVQTDFPGIIKLDGLIYQDNEIQLTDSSSCQIDLIRPDDKDDHPFLGENFLPFQNYMINEMAASLNPRLPPPNYFRTPMKTKWSPLYFKFTDGLCLALDEIFFHPYVIFIDIEIVKYIKDNFRIFMKDEDYQDLGKNILRKIKSFLPIYLIQDSSAFSKNKDDIGKGVYSFRGLVSIDFKSQQNFILHSKIYEIEGREYFVVESEVMSSFTFSKQLSSSFFQLSDDRLFVLSNFEHDDIDAFLMKQKLMFKIDYDCESSKMYGFDFSLRHSFNRSPIHSRKINYSLLKKVEMPDNKCLINFEDESLSNCSITILGNTRIQGDFELLVTYFLTAFEKGGISTANEITPTEVATSNPEKRKYDLKFLKHPGVYFAMACTFLAKIEVAINAGSVLKTSELGKIIDEVYSEGIKVFFHSLDTDHSLGIDEAQKYLSRNIKGEVKRWIITTWNFLNSSKLMLKDGEIIQSSNIFYFQVLKSITLSLIPFFESRQLFKTVRNSFSITEGDYRVLISGSHLINWALGLQDNLFVIKIQGKEIESISPERLTSQIEIEGSGAEKWFELNPKIYFDGEEIELADAFKLIKGDAVFYRGKFYKFKNKSLPSLDWLQFFWEKIKVENDRKKTKSEGMMLYLPKSEILTLFALKKSGIPIKGDESWDVISKKFDDLESNMIELNASLEQHLSHIPLREFQKKGVGWLTQLTGLGMGGILADDMGLGKTLQALSFLEYKRKLRDLQRPVLVIVPTSLIYNWINETEKFTPTIKFEIFDRKNRDFLREKISNSDLDAPVFLIATYGLLTENEDFFTSIEWQFVFFDEAQSLKNISAKRTSTARLLKADVKICLTGTPMENHYGEFFSLIDLILPGALGDYSKFRARYIQGKPSMVDLDFIKLASHPLVLRRKKELILSELPSKTETPFKINFNNKQQKIYRDLAITWNKNILDVIDKKGEASSQMEMLTALLRLRQVCSYPQMVPNVEYTESSPKEELLIDQVQQIVGNGSSVLVFCQFKSSLHLLQKALEDQGIKVFFIHGDKNASERKKTLKEFEEFFGGSVLIMTLKTGGVGLNLTKASYVIHFEPWWNPAVENQATDRAHRMGQKNPVQVYKYMIADSIEERIQELKDKKKSAFDSLFEAENLELTGLGSFNHSGLSQSDFEYLLR